MAFRWIGFLAIVGQGISTSETCDETSALQVTQLQDRSKRRMEAVASQSKVSRTDVEKSIAGKGDVELESSTSSKSGKSLAQLEKEITDYEAKVATAKASFDSAKDGLISEMEQAVERTAELTGDIAALASEAKELTSFAAMKAYSEAEEKLLQLETKLATLYDDVLLKYGKKLKNAAEAEIQEIKVKMNGLVAKAGELQTEIKTRLSEVVDTFYRIKEDIATTYDRATTGLKAKLDSAKSEFETKLADAKDKLKDVSTEAKKEAAELAAKAANAAEEALVIALVPVAIAVEQMENIAEIAEDLRVKTNAKLVKLRSSAQRKWIKFKEYSVNAASKAQQEAKDLLDDAYQKTQEWSDAIEAKFDEQTTKVATYVDEFKTKATAAVVEVQGAFVDAMEWSKSLKDSAVAKIKEKYDDAVMYQQEIQDKLKTIAVKMEEIVVAQTEAAKQIAEDSYNDLKYQLKRAKRSAEAKVKESRAEIQEKIDEAKAEFETAKDNVKYAAEKAKKVVDDFVAAAAKAGQELVDEAKALIDDAIETVNELIQPPDDWASGNGQAGKCEKAKRYRFDTGSELKKYHASSKSSCQEKCQAYEGCAFWVQYQSFDCHLFDSTAVVKIDASFSNTPCGGPVDCEIIC